MSCADAARAAAAVRALLDNDKWATKLAPFARAASAQTVSSHFASLALKAQLPTLGADELTVIGSMLFDIDTLAAGCLVSHAWRVCMVPAVASLASRARAQISALTKHVPQRWHDQRQTAVNSMRRLIDFQEVIALRLPPRRVPRAFLSALTLAGVIGEAEIAHVSQSSDGRVEWQAIKKVLSLSPKKSIQHRMLLEALGEVDCASLASGCNAMGLAVVRAWRAEDTTADIGAFSTEAARYASIFTGHLVSWTLSVLEEVDEYEADHKMRKHAEEFERWRRLLSDIERRQQRHQRRVAELAVKGEQGNAHGTQAAPRMVPQRRERAGRSPRLTPGIATRAPPDSNNNPGREGQRPAGVYST